MKPPELSGQNDRPDKPELNDIRSPGGKSLDVGLVHPGTPVVHEPKDDYRIYKGKGYFDTSLLDFHPDKDTTGVKASDVPTGMKPRRDDVHVDLGEVQKAYEQYKLLIAPVDSDTVPADSAGGFLESTATGLTRLRSDVDIIVSKTGVNDPTDLHVIVTDLVGRITSLEATVQEQRLLAKAGSPIERSTLDLIADSLIRITIFTLVGGLFVGPGIAWIFNSPLGAKMLELTFSSLVGSIAVEAGVAATRGIDLSEPPVGASTRQTIHDQEQGSDTDEREERDKVR